MNAIDKFITDQLSVWPMASANFRALKSAKVRDVEVCGLKAKIQHNPGRIISSTAEVDERTIASRACFLCEKNRPQEQFHLRFEGKKGRIYNVQLNPYPIFPKHLVIARHEHITQAIWHHFPDMLKFTGKYPEYLVFYNGPKSGASAPDHLHFQACPRHHMPLEDAIDAFLDNPGRSIAHVQDAQLFHYKGYLNGVYALKARTSKSMAKMFYRLLECSPRLEGETEPKFNLFTYFKQGEYRAFVMLRSNIRSHHYYSTGEDHLTMSPGAADMAGFLVAPKEEDYLRSDGEILSDMLREVSISEEEDRMVLWRLTRTQQYIEVGIMSAEEITFEIISDGAGPQKVSISGGRINYNGALYDELYFDSVTRSTLFAEPSFVLYGVTIGKEFHWQQKVDQKFAGSLKFIVEGDRLTAVNRVGVEDYLLSVISSEMKPSASLEFLKAHAVISRSWVMCNLHTHGKYDVCADDHCQRYQGVTMVQGETARQAVDQTWGQVLTYDGKICDTRFSKCCGGRSEIFSTCWEDKDYPYLQSVVDPYCDCENDEILKTVLNDYDLLTRDFHDWEVRYTREELSELFRRRTGIDVGTVRELEPLERGVSGRIKRMRVTGTEDVAVIGKELAIRRALSESHLKSSAFDIVWEGDTLILRGHGWGHGVGLCQIGAAVMASKGFDYKEILKYYYAGTEVR